MALTVIGIFDDAHDAQRAVEALISAGFNRTSIDLSAGRSAGTTGTNEVFPDRHVNTSGTRTEEVVDDAKDVGSGIGNFFSSLFGDDDTDNARRYSTVADRGSVVTVHAQTETEAERAADILDQNGAVNVDERATQYGYTGTTTGVANTAPTTDQTIQVVEENLQVGKRTVEQGGVRLRSRIVARPVEESVRLRQERVIVQRTPVNRPVSATELNTFQEGEITLTEHAEVPVVAKTANVVEEISIQKEVTERDEVVRDTVRKTEVDIEEFGATDATNRPAQRTGDDDVTYATK